MKKIIFAVAAFLFLGAGCQQPTPIVTAPTVSEIVYTNSIGDYSFSYPDTFSLVSNLYGEKASSTDQYVYLIANEGTKKNLGLEFILEKTTVYPESKLNELKKKYFPSIKTELQQIKINSLSGWELVGEVSGKSDQAHNLLYFPHGSYELLVLEFSEDNSVKKGIINTLKSTK